MPTIHPSTFPYPNEDKRWAEKQVFDKLNQIDDEWTVLYSVDWLGSRNGHVGDGEADFVLLHPRYGMFIVEVKGGAEIRIKDGQWQSKKSGNFHNIVNPFDQAKLSKIALDEILAERVPGFGGRKHMGHIVIFPSANADGLLGPDASPEIVIQNSDFEDFENSLKKACEYWKNEPLGPTMVQSIKSVLLPVTSWITRKSVDIDSIIDKQIELTNNQYEIMRGLRHHRRALIEGTAGTGKTVLATEHARHLAASGSKTLLVCFNKLLAEEIKLQLDDTGVTVSTFHLLCMTLGDEAGLLDHVEKDDYFYNETLPEILMEASASLNRKFDAIIVDESQDFLPNWFISLESMFEDENNALFYIFADSNQNIRSEKWEKPFETEPFLLRINCRNTRQIAEKVKPLCEEEVSHREVDGKEPIYHSFNTENQLKKKVLGTIEKLVIEDAVPPSKIQILTISKQDRELFSGLRGNGFYIKNKKDSKKSVSIETVQRFKGLESEVVILILHSPSDSNLKFRELAYIGMSRARVLLYVFGSEATKDAILWERK